MGMSGLKLLKYVLFFFNLLFWFCGCCILGFGIYLLIHNNLWLLPFLPLGNVLVIVGSIIMVVAFLGCMGSIKENKCLLMSFFILLLIILLAEVTLAILLFVYEQKLNKYVSESLTTSIQKYRSDNSTREMWDSIQSLLQCCGVNGTSDWNGHPPASCPQGPQVQGCYAKAKQWFHSNFLHVGIITICVCVIQVLGMSFALTLNCQIDKTSQALGL
ncbi:leukocyte surface antigen CD53 [Panthera pardus]|uniref:Tetraspanin n=3 Tax=Panthera TaxID=9688 RepID=A0A8C8WQL4_PANLE|nr:leukocyte surface antigen CD53 [Panthera tigris]XP_019313352.2 leukocyte surface antigen CD53 [Panthera pardus]XP_042809297.1 leukocyte surface antigen CD53 isoform X1 [Panthera leo]XP_042809298.1 leukocyte surface antigen CD53 isoform X1 [Panthera leo]XP_042854093.1 leukocyte surface antigen CD53 [Panthera tigris]XP_049472559.1 leukocyte surface antigen CD53 [Panthera uncia]XP_049472561.1 leukocyte surface antigen CD53 [Panthera uncia]XP_058572227.1 leukocyte surface antigen CD53 [Neofel